MQPTALRLVLTGLLLATAAERAGAREPSVAQALAAPSGEVGGRFGQAVAATRTRLFVGAPGLDGQAPQSGAVYAYARPGPGPGWVLEAVLHANLGAPGDDFGQALAAEGRRVAVAAPGSASPGGARVGAVHLFEAGAGGVWTEVQRLVPRSGAESQGFSSDLALSDPWLLVGDPGANQGMGVVQVYERDPRSGRFERYQELSVIGAAPGASFGARVALAGDLAVISAPGFRVPDATPGQQAVGAVYLFARTAAGSFTQLQLLAPNYPQPIEEFGADVDLSGVTLALGVPQRTLPGGSGAGLPGAGAALLLEPRPAGGWSIVRELAASNAQADDGFGGAVAVRGDLALVGAPDTVGGGAVYVFGRNVGGPGAWGECGRIDNPTGFGDFFGGALDLADTGSAFGLVGAPAADTGGVSAAGAGAVLGGLEPAAVRWRLGVEPLPQEDLGDIGHGGAAVGAATVRVQVAHQDQ